MQLISIERRGSLVTLYCQGVRRSIKRKAREISSPVFEELPLTLEEIFIKEMEAVGYDYKNIIFS